MFQLLQTFSVREITILLTGTPLQNNIRELFNLLAFLEPDKFKAEEEEQKFANLEDKEVVVKLHEMLRPHILRRLKKDVLKLPPKVRNIVKTILILFLFVFFFTLNRIGGISCFG